MTPSLITTSIVSLTSLRSARFFSPLGTYDFYKRTSLIEYSPKAIRRNGPLIAALADAEGFDHHAQAVRKRLR